MEMDTRYLGGSIRDSRSNSLWRTLDRDVLRSRADLDTSSGWITRKENRNA